MIRKSVQKGVLRKNALPLGLQLARELPSPVPSSPDPRIQHCPPGYELQLKAHLSWFQDVGRQLELRARREGDQNLGGR